MYEPSQLVVVASARRSVWETQNQYRPTVIKTVKTVFCEYRALVVGNLAGAAQRVNI